MADKAKIVVVDDHPVMRMGLGAMISATDDLEVAGEAGSASEAVDLIESLDQVDLAILDMSLPDRNGLELIKDSSVHFVYNYIENSNTWLNARILLTTIRLLQ